MVTATEIRVAGQGHQFFFAMKGVVDRRLNETDGTHYTATGEP